MNNLVQFLHFFLKKFLIWEIVEKMKTDVDRLLLILKLIEDFRYILLILDVFSIFSRFSAKL